MDSIEFRWNDKRFASKLTYAQRQGLPTAMRNALNDTVKGGRKAAQGAMRGQLNAPTPYAQRGIVYERASKTRLVASVAIYGSSWTKSGTAPANFLTPQVEGGQRSLKGFETQLVARGFMLRTEYAVPADRQRLNRYGNVTQGQINKIMSGLKVDYRGAGATRVASTEKGKSKAVSRGRYFVPPRSSHLHPGIWYEKPGRQKKIYPVFLFVKQRRYRKRFDFHNAVFKHAERNLPKHIVEGFRRHVWPR